MMDKKFSGRIRDAIASRNIPRWALGTIVVIILALVVLGALVAASQNSAISADLPGSNIVSTTGLFFDIALKLGIVILLIYIFMQLLKRWQGGKQINQKKFLSVIETTYINPRQALHLVKAGDKLLLLGSTDQSVSCLSELSPDSLIQEAVAAHEDSAPTNPNLINNFAALLAQNINKR